MPATLQLLTFCDCCNHQFREEELEDGEPQNHLADGSPVCEECIELNCAPCGDCGAPIQTRNTGYRAPDEVHETGHYRSRRHICQTCFDNGYFECSSCGQNLPHDDRSYGDPDCCQDCWNEHHFTCGDCGEEFEEDDYGGEGLCRQCYTRAHRRDDEPLERDCGPDIIGDTAVGTFGSLRCFGVELEYSECSGAEDICDSTNWGACEDGTSGVEQEFKSPKLSGDRGIDSVVKFCRLAVDNGLDVNRDCGYHLHLDMSEEKELAIARIATAYQIFLPLWRAFVPSHRRTNSFCSSDRKGEEVPEEIAIGRLKPHKDYSYTRPGRYCAVNWRAYNTHGTVEIRLHQGTMDRAKVVNWIKAHLGFCAWARKQPLADILKHNGASLPELFQVVARDAWGTDPELGEYYRQRADHFGTVV